jgi:hypothetical protein
MFTVKVFSGGLLVDEQDFATKAQAEDFASDAQDLGFKVRVETSKVNDNAYA